MHAITYNLQQFIITVESLNAKRFCKIIDYKILNFKIKIKLKKKNTVKRGAYLAKYWPVWVIFLYGEFLQVEFLYQPKHRKSRTVTQSRPRRFRTSEPKLKILIL